MRFRRPLAVLGALALGASLSGCVASERDAGGDAAGAEGGGGGGGGAFVFAASSDPVMLDPAFASDGETFRVARQIFEGLVGTVPGTADPAPLLATDWTSSDDGLSHTFTLQDGVTFHDGTAFDAEAVCANFDRWHQWTGVNQSPNLSYYYGKLFRGFATSEDPSLQGGVYGGCTADEELRATVTLTQPFAGFVQALSLPAFSMQSPTAMEQHAADGTEGSEEDPRFSEYATAHPTGTGPFRFASWERGQQVVLERNEEYWGEAASVDEAVVRVIPDGNARLQALQAGEIDGYDLVAPGDLAGLEDGGFTIAQRPAFNILYLGFNQAVPELQDLRVRQAIAHAVDRDALISQSLPEGTEAATQFMPDLVNGYDPDVTTYEHDPDRARQLLAEAGASDLTLTFNYPTDVSRPYMPTPEDTFIALQGQLQAVGITLDPVADQWTNYLDRINGTPDHGIHLLGWTGDYNDPDNFVGTFFGTATPEWGFEDQQLFDALTAARGLPTVEEQEPAYQAINQQIAERVPGVPLAHPVPSLAFAPRVQGFEPSPVQDEVWNTITLAEE
ncbi:ABC transporter substrate-binding protein [Quadrisphaera sp. DSM 44207]|uniref:ABC transporter substrate-binding protein n=1 Tax=Quadrisphaera sp. DSM 44207 TaxID=1881057 RepID=UPI000B8A0309|nr:ABC transporter substrate-binding protein [Quadrisphaera sp. DSM 44207]